MSDIKYIGAIATYNLPENHRIRNHKTYHIEITGQPKIGKSYYASKLDKPFFFDFYNGGLNGFNSIYFTSINDNIVGNMEIWINQFIDTKAKELYHTIVFDGFDVMLKKFFDEVKEMIKINYWEDKNKVNETVADFVCNYLFKWFSILTAMKYNIVLISGQQVKYSGVDGLIKRFYNYFQFKEMHIHYSNENKKGFDDDGNEIITHDKIISFDGHHYLWLD